jgi:hypothetical protein
MVSFLMKGLTTLSYAGSVPALRALDGGGVFTLVFLLFGVATGFNVLFCGTFLFRTGAVWERRASARLVRGSVPRFKCRRYHDAVYLPWGGGQHARYMVCAAIVFVTDAVSWTAGIALVKHDMPVSLVAFLAWASNCWLSVWKVRALRSGFARGKLVVPGIGVMQLAGVAIAAGVTFNPGVSRHMVGDRLVMAMVGALAVNSIVVAALKAYIKDTRTNEEAHLSEAGVGNDTTDYHLFLSVKLGFYPSLASFCVCVGGFILSGVLTGFPQVKRWDFMLLAVAIYAIASLGNRVSNVALAEGDPALSGIGSAGGIGFTFAWTWVLQRIVPTPYQLLGAALTLLGALAWAATMGPIKRRLVRRWRRSKLARVLRR